MFSRLDFHFTSLWLTWTCTVVMVWQLWFYRPHCLFFHSVVANIGFTRFLVCFSQRWKESTLLFYDVAATRAQIHSTPNHSELQWTGLNPPLLLFFFILEQFDCSLPNSDRWGFQEKPEKENSINNHSLVQQWEKLVSWPRAFWSDEVRVEAQSSSWALYLLRLPFLHTDVICCPGPHTRRGETAGPVTKWYCPEQILRLHMLAQPQHSVSMHFCCVHLHIVCPVPSNSRWFHRLLFAGCQTDEPKWSVL